MNNSFDFDVIVLGASHFNALGVIRSFGENGIKPYLLLVGDKNGYIKKSKYVKETYYADSTSKSIIDTLLSKINYDKKRCYIIPTGDPVASIIDHNMKKLSKKYIVPNINKKDNEIIKYMNKYEQYKLAKEFDLKMAKTVLLDLSKGKVKNDIYPCIMKPLVSAQGEKADIRICDDKKEFEKYIDEFKIKKYKEVLLQEFIDYDYEIDVPGYSYNNEVVIPGMIKKKNIYPAKRGSTSYGMIIPAEFEEKDKITKIFKFIKYNGVFDIELFSKNDDIFLNEINFRNSAISYGLTGNSVYVTYEWVLLNEGIKKETVINKPYYFMVEDYNFRLVLSHDISLFTFIKEFIAAKKYAYINFKDPKPLFYKFIYAVKRSK